MSSNPPTDEGPQQGSEPASEPASAPAQQQTQPQQQTQQGGGGQVTAIREVLTHILKVGIPKSEEDAKSLIAKLEKDIEQGAQQAERDFTR